MMFAYYGFGETVPNPVKPTFGQGNLLLVCWLSMPIHAYTSFWESISRSNKHGHQTLVWFLQRVSSESKSTTVSLELLQLLSTSQINDGPSM